MDSISLVEWNLPSDIIQNIFERITTKDIARLSCVASLWRDVSERPNFREEIQCEKSWRTKDVQPIVLLYYPHKTTSVICAAKEGNMLALGGAHFLLVYNTQDNGKKYLDVGFNEIQCLSFVDSLLWSGNDQGNLCVWDIEASKCLLHWDAHSWHIMGIEELEASMATAGIDFLIKIWGKRDFKLEKVLYGHKDWVTALSSTERKDRLISGSYDATIRIWRVGEGVCLNVIANGCDEVCAVLLADDIIVCLSIDTSVSLFNLNDGSKVSSSQSVHNAHCVAHSSGRIIYSLRSYDMAVWDYENNVCIRRIKSMRKDSLSWMWCDKKNIITVSCLGKVEYWDFS